MLSVLIASFNSAQTIHYTLSSLFTSKFDKDLFEVIVVDDGSTDNTVELAKKFPVRIYSCPHRGHGPTRNLGIKMAKGDIICFTDSDIVVPSDWLTKISDFFGSHPDVDAIGGPILPPPHDYYKTKIQRLTSEIYYEDQSFPTEVMQIRTLEWRTYLASANSAYRKEALGSVGGFPEYQTIKTNDMHVMWRLVENGRQLFFLPDLEVIHLGFPETIRGVFKQQFGWGKHNTMTTRAYIHMYPRKISAKEKAMRQITLPYNLAKALVQLYIRSPRDKQLLRCFHYASYYLGLLYGRGCND